MSISDELIKLKELLDNGGLTQEEFDFQKEKLLNSKQVNESNTASNSANYNQIDDAEIKAKITKAKALEKVAVAPFLLFVFALFGLFVAVDDFYPLLIIPEVLAAIVCVIVNVVTINTISTFGDVSKYANERQEIKNAHIKLMVAVLILSLLLIIIAVAKAGLFSM